MYDKSIAAAILTKTILESSPTIRRSIEKHAKKRDYVLMVDCLAGLYREVLNAMPDSPEIPGSELTPTAAG